MNCLRIVVTAALLPSFLLNSAQPQKPSTDLTVNVSKSLVLENAAGVRRVSVTNGELAEAVAVSPNEILVNGKAAGETSLILWDNKGERTIFDLHVLPSSAKFDAIRGQIASELPGQDVSLTFQEGMAFLRGTATDLVSADRAMAIASTLGKVVNLLRVKVPASEPQVLLKVRFANVDRSRSVQLGASILGLGNHLSPGGQVGGSLGGTPSLDVAQPVTSPSLTDVLNVFLVRPNFDFGAAIKALEEKQLAQVLAEPNLLTISGHRANFLAGGEFPFPTLQGGGSGVGQITIQFREFGIRLGFNPTVTPRGTILLDVEPEVSSLDPSNGLTIGGYTIPGLNTRRVQTEVELQNNQSLVIAGLLDNRLTETINRVPGLASIPLLGKLFESRSMLKNNSELLVVVTPEIVRPIAPGQVVPDVKMPEAFLKDTRPVPPQNPAPRTPDALPRFDAIPIETLKNASAPAPVSTPPPTAPSDSPSITPSQILSTPPPSGPK